MTNPSLALPDSPELKCAVCGKSAIGVCNALGPMSDAFCRECLVAGRVSYGNLVAYLYTGEPKKLEDLADWVHPTVTATLDFYGKTWEDFALDCTEANRGYDEYCAGRGSSRGEE